VWWEPRSAHESSLARAIEQLQRWFNRQERGEHSLALGFGSVWSKASHELVPLVLLNSEVLRWPLRGEREIEPLPLAGRLGPPDPTLELVEISPKVHFLPVGAPRASALTDNLLADVLAVRDPVMCAATGEMGTAGVSVHSRSDGARGLLTAGHVFPIGKGSKALRVRWRFLGLRRKSPLGTVTHHVVPKGSVPGWDAAVIRAEGQIPMGVKVVSSQLRRFDEQEPVIAYGAFSGAVHNAHTHGGLVTLRSSAMQWKNCWMTAPSGILTHGDSGAAVFTRAEGKFLGLYVGHSTVGGDVSMHYVQDSFTLEQQVLEPWGISF
jgi:hypothetical protein